MSADGRKDKRAPVSLKVRFKSATVDEFIEHYSKDVSRGGIYIKSSQPMAVGTLLKFQFQLKDESALIRGVGRVVWTRAEVDATADSPAGMGIKFIKMDDDSRQMVERIVDLNAPDPGSYVSGRAHATSAEPSSSAPPPTGGGNFFPDLPPAELPPPEDRTAVRHATQFLAAALTEAGTDEAATKEAQAKAEEAKKRQEEVEAQRRQEAEVRKAQEEAEREAADADDEAARTSLPSMIIDPSLEPRAGRPSEAARETEVTPIPRPHVAFGNPSADDASEPDTEPPPPPEPSEKGIKSPTTSIPPLSVPPKRNFMPIVAIAAVIVIGLFVALRGGPEEKPVDQPVAEPIADKRPEPLPPPVPEPKQEEPVPEPPATPDAAVAEPATPAGTSVETVDVEVQSTPKGAEVWLAGEKKGEAPVSVALPTGSESTLTLRMAGFQELTKAITPVAGKRVPTMKLKLKPIPYIVHVETTPPGAAINVAGVKGTAPADLTLDKPPTQELSVTAKLDGYERALTRIPPSAFSEGEGAMRTQLSLTLKAKELEAPKVEPAPAPPPPAKKTKKKVEAKPAIDLNVNPPAEAAPEPAKVEPAKAEPAPDAPKQEAPEPLQPNPFGQ